VVVVFVDGSVPDDGVVEVLVVPDEVLFDEVEPDEVEPPEVLPPVDPPLELPPLDGGGGGAVMFTDKNVSPSPGLLVVIRPFATLQAIGFAPPLIYASIFVMFILIWLPAAPVAARLTLGYDAA
jgi:hypothetical protein